MTPQTVALPGSSVLGILQARILEWVCHSLLQGIFLIQGNEPRSPALQEGSLLSELPRKPRKMGGEMANSGKFYWWLKRLPTMKETRVQSLGQEDPLEKEMATHSSILAWKIPWTENPGRLQSMGSQRVGHDWATSLTYFTDSPPNNHASATLPIVLCWQSFPTERGTARYLFFQPPLGAS